MTDTDRMVAWLREAVDAAQRDAENAARAFPDWEFDEFVNEIRDVPNAGTVAYVPVPEFGPHIARQSPAVVLRRIAADRKQLALHRAEPGQHPDFCGYDKHQLPCPGLRLLAEGWGWTEETTKPDWPECMCTPGGECGNCWEKRQQAAT